MFFKKFTKSFTIIYFPFSLYFTYVYLKLISNFIYIIIFCFPLYLLVTALRNAIYQTLSNINTDFPHDRNSDGVRWNDLLNLRFEFIQFFASPWRISKGFFTSPFQFAYFFLLVGINIVIGVTAFLVAVIIWYPYWIIKLFYYIFSKNILKFEPNVELDFIHKYLLLMRRKEDYLKVETVLEKIIHILLVKTNAFSYFTSYTIIYHLIDKFLFFIKNPNFFTKIVLFLFLFIFSLSWLILTGVFLPVYYALRVSFWESIGPTISTIYKRKNFRKEFMKWRGAESFKIRYTCKTNSIFKTKRKLFNLNNSSWDLLKDAWKKF